MGDAPVFVERAYFVYLLYFPAQSHLILVLRPRLWPALQICDQRADAQQQHLLLNVTPVSSNSLFRSSTLLVLSLAASFLNQPPSCVRHPTFSIRSDSVTFSCLLIPEREPNTPLSLLFIGSFHLIL